VVQRLVAPTPVRNLLSGTNLGHPLHPMLTDVPIGAWVLAAMLDAVGGPKSEKAADLLVGAGIVAAVPTAASGINDWSDTAGRDTRVGLVHAAANTTALSAFAASLVARTLGRRQLGKSLGLLGCGVLAVGGYLGGHLSYVRGVNVNRTAYENRPREWTRAASDSDLAEGSPTRVEVGGAPVLLVREAGRTYALSAVCSHMGGPLEEGQLRDGCVVCPWHGSTFRLADGYIVRGPASTPQPRYETRLIDGWIEVRARQ
jgi:nitrite reductase/ring-hydroxylating ferredoxin subunit/uncharacterized membrane protein